MLPFKRLPGISEQVSDLMLRTVEFYPHCDLSDATADTWLEAWIQLAEKYGMPRLTAAVNRLKFDTDFFPKPSEIWREIDNLMLEENSAKRANATQYASCGRCSSCGLILVNAEGEVWDGKTREERFARNCECRVAWLAARERRKNE